MFADCVLLLTDTTGDMQSLVFQLQRILEEYGMSDNKYKEL